MKCDLCGQSSPLVQVCAFGELGITIHAHPWCGSELAEMPKERQDATLRILKQETSR